MTKYEAVFFDIKDQEKDFYIEHLKHLCNLKFIEEPLHSYENIDELTENTDILTIFTSSRATKEILQKFKKLKFLATRSTGYSHIDIEYCSENNTPVVNVCKYGDCTVSEFAFSLLLNISRKVQEANQDLKKGLIDTEKYIGNDLYQKTIGIIGTGGIGSHSARIAYGFGMNILAYDPYPKQALVEQYGAEYVPFQTLLQNSDYISVHAPATKASYHMINKEAFKIMKNGVIIVNTARGEVIDTEALYHALLSKKVKGAGLDVLECEEMFGHEKEFLDRSDCLNSDCLKRTLINHKLIEVPNVIVTPHIAFDTIEAVDRIMEKTVENIKLFDKGEFQNKVN